ncbi:MAG: ligase-associated DNA damage response exonuclease [Alphaproteobacteria bacterium]
MKARDLIEVRSQGLYCPPGDFYVDPVRAVDRAVVTHGHSDHARSGHGAVLATAETLAIMKIRYGENFARNAEPLVYGEVRRIGDVDVHLVPAGHVLGSAQVVIEGGGARVVISGDYKRRDDPTCPPFEPVPCDVFITEATFALPVFRHPPFEDEIAKLLQSRALFPERTHLIGAYALGKAQRVIAGLRAADYNAPIYIHGALDRLCAMYQGFGVDLGDLRPVTGATKAELEGAIAIAPPSALQDRWTRRLADPVSSFASGWMGVRARARQRGVELPLVISDHADWDELTSTLSEMRPAEIWITHGREDALSRWCALNGIGAKALSLVGYEDEDGEISASESDSASAEGAA